MIRGIKLSLNMTLAISGLEGWHLDSDQIHYMEWYSRPYRTRYIDESGRIQPLVAKMLPREILSFGFPWEYYFKDIEARYPFQRPLVVDAGNDIWIPAKDVNRVIKHFRGY